MVKVTQGLDILAKSSELRLGLRETIMGVIKFLLEKT